MEGGACTADARGDHRCCVCRGDADGKGVWQGVEILEHEVGCRQHGAVDHRGDEFLGLGGDKIAAVLKALQKEIGGTFAEGIDEVLRVSDASIEGIGGKAGNVDLGQSVVFKAECDFSRVGAEILRAVGQVEDEKILVHTHGAEGFSTVIPLEVVVEGV